MPQREAQNIITADLMGVGLDADWPALEPIILSVERVAVIQFHALVLGEEESITGEYACAVGRALVDAIAPGVVDETPERLNARFILIDRRFLLRKRRY